MVWGESPVWCTLSHEGYERGTRVGVVAETIQVTADVPLLASTIATSSAALSAILGGFLVVRASDLGSRREQRADALNEATRWLRREEGSLAAAKDQLTAALTTQFVEQCVPEIIRKRGGGSVHMFYEQHQTELPEEAVSPELSRVREVIAQAFELMQTEADETLVPVASSYAEYVRLVALHLRASRPPAAGLSPTQRAVGARRPELLSNTYRARQDAAAVAVDNARTTVAVAEQGVSAAEEEVTERRHELRSIPEPKDAYYAYGVLALFALLNCIGPMVVMALAPIEVESVVPSIMVEVFAAGLVLVFDALYGLLLGKPRRRPHLPGWLRRRFATRGQ